jgi:hypothetical protein
MAMTNIGGRSEEDHEKNDGGEADWQMLSCRRKSELQIWKLLSIKARVI